LGCGKPFIGNTATDWGNMFEKVAQLTYEKLHHVDLMEFGLLFDLDSENHWIAASPDGIRSDAVALLEIKCPLIRNVGNPIPFNYWTQVLWQMQTCKIDKTHFMDCRINYYATRRTWLQDMQLDIEAGTSVWNVKDAHHEQSWKTAFAIQEGRTFKYGAIVEVKTFNAHEQIISTVIEYPEAIHDTVDEIDQWTSKIVTDAESDPFKRARIILYKMENLVIFTVPYSQSWFDRNKTRLWKLWNSILQGRQNLSTSADVSVLAKRILTEA
jgi:hypothetical protein